MATKTKPKARTSKSSTNKSTFKFHWWMALVLVFIVAVVGLVVLRYSHAAGPFTANDTGGGSHICIWSNGGLYCTNVGSSTVYVPILTGKNSTINYYCRESGSYIDTYAGRAYLCPVTGG
jgi:hypothetical protein